MSSTSVDAADDAGDEGRTTNEASVKSWKKGKAKISIRKLLTPKDGGAIISELGKTLLDRTKDKKGYGDGFAQAISSRIMVVAKMGKKLLSQPSTEVLGQSIENDIRQASSNSLQDRATGICLCYGDHCLIVLECETDFFNRAMSIIEGYHTNGWLKKSSKVLLSSDTSTPQFSSYSYKLLTNSTTQHDFTTQDELPQVAAECVAMVAKLGDVSANDVQNNPDLISAEGLIQFLVKQRDLETFLEHQKRQLAHSDFVLEGEVTWPVAERYYPYD